MRCAQFDAATRFDCTDRLAQIAAPTLIVHGAKDRTAPRALAEQMRAQIPGARLALVAGGHRFPLTRPQQLVDEVDAFLVAH